jgi:hypothetical protein
MDHLSLRKLTNAYLDLQLFNLEWYDTGKGPYLVRLVGYPPGSTEMKVDPYILQNDGVWIISYHFATFTPEEQEARLFKTRRQLIELLDAIGGKDVLCISTLPEGLSDEEILRRYREYGRRTFRNLLDEHAQCIVPPSKSD